MKTLHLIVAKVDEQLFNGEAVSVTLPGAAGVFTVLSDHEPLVTTLKEGTLSVEKEDGEVEKFSLTHGLVEISHNRATVLL